MSDRTFAVLNGINKKLKDMGDGTFAEIVYNANASGGGSGGAVTVADGANVAQGMTTDAAFAGTGATTLVGALKGIYARLGSLVLAAGTNVIGIVDAADLDVTGSVTSAAVLFTQDVSNFGSVGVQITSWGAGNSIAFEGSNDNTNWAPLVGTNSALGAQTGGSSTTVAGSALIHLSTAGVKYFRVRVYIYGSGTVAVAARFKKQVIPPQWVISPILAAGTNPVGALTVSSSSSGALSSVYRLLASSASTNAANIKSGTGKIYKIDGYNAAASVRYLKLYAKASAPTVGTDIPLATIALAPSSRFEVNWADLGLYCGLGIGIALTTGSADSDTGAVSANDVLGLNIAYA